MVKGKISISLFLLLVISAFFMLQFRLSQGKPPTIAGYNFLIVLTGSMTPTFDKGSIVVVKRVAPDLLMKGNIITFRGSNNPKILITHRILQVYKKEAPHVFKTKGDANKHADINLVQSENILGQVKFVIPKLGYFFQFILSPFGFLILIVLVAAINKKYLPE